MYSVAEPHHLKILLSTNSDFSKTVNDRFKKSVKVAVVLKVSLAPMMINGPLGKA